MNNIILTTLSNEELIELISSSLKSVLENTNQNPPTPDEQLIKIDEVCELFKVSKPTIFEWKKAGKLPFYRIGRRVYFKKNEIMDCMKSINRRA